MNLSAIVPLHSLATILFAEKFYLFG